MSVITKCHMKKTNPKKISLVVLTSSEPRHNFFVHQLAERFDIKGIVIEQKPKPLERPTVKDKDLIERHTDSWRQKEKEYLSKYITLDMPDVPTHTVDHSGANDEQEVAWIKGLDPDYIAIFGTSIIREQILVPFDKKVINIHLGISPYYRGFGGNFWPLVFNEPECVGFTIHLAVIAADAGALLYQGRPDIEINDDCHDLGIKAAIKGLKAFPHVIRAYDSNLIKAQVQPSGGKVFKNKDFTAEAIITMRKNFENGMLDKYLKDKTSRDGRFPIIDPKLS